MLIMMFTLASMAWATDGGALLVMELPEKGGACVRAKGVSTDFKECCEYSRQRAHWPNERPYGLVEWSCPNEFQVWYSDASYGISKDQPPQRPIN